MGRILQPSKVESRNEITHAILLESPEVYDVLRVSLVVVEGHIEVAPGVVHGVRRRVVLGRVPPAERRDLSARRLEVVELALAALADEDAGDDDRFTAVIDAPQLVSLISMSDDAPSAEDAEDAEITPPRSVRSAIAPGVVGTGESAGRREDIAGLEKHPLISPEDLEVSARGV